MSSSESCSGPPSICWSKPLTAKLIQLHRQNPCLWNVKLEGYKNRGKRITALKAIAVEIREHGASVTTDDIKMKIDVNNMRVEYIHPVAKNLSVAYNRASAVTLCRIFVSCFRMYGSTFARSV
ncbi:hypothetical protein SK128_009812 [Halocaridina rubra]|uniref:MADF domain-containing protein n=1 Tax=Halocaridina rubra TaxID=373956 RepID=A0AAN8ZWW8_HALRR